MRSKLANAVALYLAPLLSLTALVLVSLSFLSPVVILQTQAPLVVVKSTLLLVPNTSRSEIDGPSVFLGPLGTSTSLQVLDGAHSAF